MKNRVLSILLIGIISAGLLSACTGIGSPASGGSNNPPRILSVTGSGKVNISPDIAYINIGVHTEADTVADALAGNTAQAQAVSDALKGLGVDAKDIQTTAFNVYPQQQYGPMGEMLSIKYVVDNSVYITVRDLNNMGRILDTVVKSGANNINGIQFDLADRTKAIAQAREAAMTDARTQAEELAAVAGAQLGDVQSINIYNTGMPVGMYDMKGGSAMAGNAVPISAGQMVISVEVNVSYLLK